MYGIDTCIDCTASCIKHKIKLESIHCMAYSRFYGSSHVHSYILVSTKIGSRQKSVLCLSYWGFTRRKGMCACRGISYDTILNENQFVCPCISHYGCLSLLHYFQMGSYLCLLTPLNWEEQLASPVMERTLRLRRVLLLPPAVGRRAHDTASVSLPLSASSSTSSALPKTGWCTLNFTQEQAWY